MRSCKQHLDPCNRNVVAKSGLHEANREKQAKSSDLLDIYLFEISGKLNK